MNEAELVSLRQTAAALSPGQQIPVDRDLLLAALSRRATCVSVRAARPGVARYYQ